MSKEEPLHMSKGKHILDSQPGSNRKLEGRYAYYRRCQVLRKSGEQCKAPAEKGTVICHAHAGQQATRQRQEQQRRMVLAEAAARIRGRGRQEFDTADIFMDFQGIQAAIAVMAQALIDGRIDCKTAGRLAVELQTASKLLLLCHQVALPQAKAFTTKDTNKDTKKPPGWMNAAMAEVGAAEEDAKEEMKARFMDAERTAYLTRSARNGERMGHPVNGPPEWIKAA